MAASGRFRVTELVGYAELCTRADVDAEPGATFDVHDDLTGRVVARFRSEDVAAGLPHRIRVNVARWRAHDRLATLERELELGAVEA